MVANQVGAEVCGESFFSKNQTYSRGSSTQNQNGKPNGIKRVCPEHVKVLSLTNTNPHILGFRAMEYAARGPVITRAISLEQELALIKQVNTMHNILC